MKKLIALRLVVCALLGAALIQGCSNDSKDPVAPPVQPPAAPLRDADLVALVLRDATERIVPSLMEGAPRDRLAQALDTLLAAVRTRVVKSVQAAARVSRAAVVDYGAYDANDITAAELDAIRLYLDYVDEKVAASGAGN